MLAGGCLVNFAEPPPGDVPSGQELLTEFVRYGRQRPFEEIVRRCAGMVYNTCLRVTKDKHDAEDAAQAVFLTLALQVKKGTDIKALGPWLQQVAKRLSLDLRRGKKRRSGREQRHHDEQSWRRECAAEDTLPSADLDEIKTVLQDELHKLPSKYRLPLILHYFGGLSRDEMAEQLNCNTSTLGVRIFRGRALLAERLRGRGMHFNPILLPMMLGAAVRGTVSQAMFAATSHAAAALAAGHDGVGLVSSRVIRLSRRAAATAVFAKVKIAFAALLLLSTVLAAGARAVGVLPHIDLQSIVVQQVQRLVRPLFQPLSIPVQVRGPWLVNPWINPAPAALRSLHVPRQAHQSHEPALADGWQVNPFAPAAIVPPWDVPPVGNYDAWDSSGVIDPAALADAAAEQAASANAPLASADDASDADDDDADGSAGGPAMADVSDTAAAETGGEGAGGGGGAFAFTKADRPALTPGGDDSSDSSDSDGEWSPSSASVFGLHGAARSETASVAARSSAGDGDSARSGGAPSRPGSAADGPPPPSQPGSNHSRSPSRSPSARSHAHRPGSGGWGGVYPLAPPFPAAPVSGGGGTQRTSPVTNSGAATPPIPAISDLVSAAADPAPPPPNAAWLAQVILAAVDGDSPTNEAAGSNGMVARPGEMLAASGGAENPAVLAIAPLDPSNASTGTATGQLTPLPAADSDAEPLGAPAVPEPASLYLLVLGGSMLLRRRFRR